MRKEKDSTGKENTPYADLYDLPHHQSAHHPHMTMQERAAQFSPFAALTGYEGEIRETARRTENRRELTEEAKALLDVELQKVYGRLEQGQPADISLTYFRQDERKAGGSYQTLCGPVTGIDPLQNRIRLAEAGWIPVADIVNMEIIS